MLFGISFNSAMEIEWDHIESFYFVPYLPKKEVSQTGIFLGEQIVKAWGVYKNHEKINFYFF